MVEEANGQPVPYLGYTEMSVVFPKEFLGVEAEVPTLALVVPDVHAASQPVVLIGTNTLDVLYGTYHDTISEIQPPTSHGYKAVLKVHEQRHQQSRDCTLWLVTMHDKGSQLIPAGQKMLLP